MKRVLFILSILCLSFGQSQVLIDNTGTENASPNESAILDLKSEDKGLLLPRITNQDLSALEVEGMLIYDQSMKCFKGWDGYEWVNVGGTCIERVEYVLTITPPEDPAVEGEPQIFSVELSPPLVAGDSIMLAYEIAGGYPNDFNELIGVKVIDITGAGGVNIIFDTRDNDDIDGDRVVSLNILLSEAISRSPISVVGNLSESTIVDNDVEGKPNVRIPERILSFDDASASGTFSIFYTRAEEDFQIDINTDFVVPGLSFDPTQTIIPAGTGTGTHDVEFTWEDIETYNGSRSFNFNIVPSATDEYNISGNARVNVTIVEDDAAAGVMMVKETFGTPSGTTSIIGYTGFDNTNLTFDAEGGADVRTTSASSTARYSQASGGGNVMINNSNKSLMISGFNYTSVSGPLTLQMGIRKNDNNANGSSLTIEYSTDNGISWTDITYSDLPTGSGTSNWHYATISNNIPNEITDLRFQGTDTTEYRLDDIELTY